MYKHGEQGRNMRSMINITRDIGITVARTVKGAGAGTGAETWAQGTRKGAK